MKVPLGTAWYPRLALRRDAGQPRAAGELKEGWREQDPSVLHLILDPSLLGRSVCALCRGLAPMAAVPHSAWMPMFLWSAGLRLPALADELWRGHHLLLQVVVK